MKVQVELTARLSDRDAMAEVRADRLSLLRVFRNLFDNALKYGGDRLSEIRLGYEESGDCHIFSVHDNGVRVKTEDLERIFGLFQRNSTSMGIDGSGLGLAIVKEAEERHHGSVWVESESGGGSTFFFSISKTRG
jgi:signal transduction histidine kinase